MARCLIVQLGMVPEPVIGVTLPKIPFFSNKEYMQKLVIENNTMMERLEENRKKTKVFLSLSLSIYIISKI